MISRAIILAAGMGTRLMPLTELQPKCLTEVNGNPIIVNALSILSRNGVQETTIVIGYLGGKIKEAVGNQVNGMDIRYVENPIYDKTNTSYSLLLALEEIEEFESLFVLEGDVFFEEALLQILQKNSEKNITAVEKYNPMLDGTFAELNESGFVIDWVHKKNRAKNYEVETKFKTVNIHKFCRKFVELYLKPVLIEQVNLHQGNIPMEDVMRKIVNLNNNLIYSIETSNLKWFEIDDMNDLKIAEKIFR